MLDKKKASTSSAKRVEAKETAGFGGSAISTKDSTTKAGTWQGQVRGSQVTISGRAVSALLHIGRENALPLRDLCRFTGMGGRQVRLMIQRERLKGVPILSDNQSGYYLPADEREVVEFVRSMRHRAGEIEKAAGMLEGVYYGR